MLSCPRRRFQDCLNGSLMHVFPVQVARNNLISNINFLDQNQGRRVHNMPRGLLNSAKQEINANKFQMETIVGILISVYRTNFMLKSLSKKVKKLLVFLIFVGQEHVMLF